MLEWPLGAKVVVTALPFMMASTGEPQEINKTRLLEVVIQSVIISGVIAIGGLFIALPVIQEKLEQMRKEGLETRAVVSEMRREIRQEIDNRTGKRDLLDGAQDSRIRQLELDLARRR